MEIAEYIKRQILDGELKPGDQLVVRAISEKLGVSQTPVREAIQHLSGENIIVYNRNRGYFIYKYNQKDVFEIYSLRAILESLAIRLATQRSDENEINELKGLFFEMETKLHDDNIKSLSDYSYKIHNYIYKLSKHERLIRFNNSISFQISVLNMILGKENTKTEEVEEHRELIKAIKSGDPDFAEKVMRHHVFRSYGKILEIGAFENEESFSSGKLSELFPK